MADKLWKVCNVCGGKGTEISGEPPTEVPCTTCMGKKVLLVGYIDGTYEDALAAFEEDQE